MTPAAIWIIIPVHNRMATTQACLERLAKQGLHERMTICVVDDGSTDGTTEMLARDFPEVLRVVGNGHLYWGGGILEGMMAANQAEAEVVVWLNDDCQPEPGAIDLLVRHVIQTNGIAGGICRAPDNLTVQTYSGTRLGENEMVSPKPGQSAPVDFINGNLVAIHREVVGRIGFPPGRELPQYGGDSIYSLRARRAGIACEVLGSALATNPPNPYFDRFGVTKPAWTLLKEPFRVGSILYWPTYWRFLREAFGIFAYFRWPCYFHRLARTFIEAQARQYQNRPAKHP